MDLPSIEKLSSKQHLGLANKLVKAKKYKEAVAHLNAVLKTNPNHFKASWILYRALDHLDSTDDQRLILEGLYKSHPNDIDVLSEICKTYYHQKFLVKALTLCKKAIQKDSSNPVNHAHLAKSYWDYGKESIALNVIKTASKRFPKDFSTQNIAGQIYLGNKNDKLAMQYFQNAYDIDPKNPSVNIELAKLYAKEKKHKEALELLIMSCKTDPYSSRTPLRMATTQLRLSSNYEWAEKYTVALSACHGKKNTKKLL